MKGKGREDGRKVEEEEKWKVAHGREIRKGGGKGKEERKNEKLSK